MSPQKINGILNKALHVYTSQLASLLQKYFPTFQLVKTLKEMQKKKKKLIGKK